MNPGPAPEPRVPFAPLERYVPDTPDGTEVGVSNEPHGLAELARRTGISRRALMQWRELGVPARSIARAAWAIAGTHPENLWPAADTEGMHEMPTLSPRHVLTLTPTARPRWFDSRECLDVDPAIFYPPGLRFTAADSRPAKDICARCPVSRECLHLAIENGETDGIWGGLTPKQRKHYARELAQVAS